MTTAHQMYTLIEALVRAEFEDDAMAAMVIARLPADCAWMRAYRAVRQCIAEANTAS